VVFIVALVLFVNHETAGSDQPAPIIKPAAIAEQNRETRALESEVQAPHVTALRPGQTPRKALSAAVVGAMRRQIAADPVEGPLMRSRSGCTSEPSGPGASRTRLVFRCEVEAANVNYPFLGVVDTASEQVTYCERAVSTVPVPVSRRCT
jgi:hypothetical protein